jgi:hypothetical protein
LWRANQHNPTIAGAAELQETKTELPPKSVTQLSTIPKGVTLRDAAMHYCEGDESQASKEVKRITDSKRFKLTPLGKCPLDSRARLYDYREVLGVFQAFYNLSQVESERLKSSLNAKLRNPTE